MRCIVKHLNEAQEASFYEASIKKSHHIIIYAVRGQETSDMGYFL